MATQIVKQVIGELAERSRLLDWLLKGKVIIFTFHRVLTEQAYQQCRFERSIVVTDTGLETFITRIRKRYEIIALSEWLQMIPSSTVGKARPKAILTFDDGWQDNYTTAFPILARHRVPATIFLSTDFIDSELGFWWQHLGEMITTPTLAEPARANITALLESELKQDSDTVEHFFHEPDQLINLIKTHHYDKAIPLTKAIARILQTDLAPHGLTWQQCQEMSAHGIEFGSHTASHPRLTLLNETQSEHELAVSKAILKDQPVNYVDAICYPYGDHDDAVCQRAQHHYRLGFTTRTGISPVIPEHPMKIPRINVPAPLTQKSGLLNYRLLKAALKG